MANKSWYRNSYYYCKGEMIMKKQTAGFMKGIGTGVAVGIVASVAGKMMYDNNKKSIKKTAKKAVKAMGGMVDSVQNMMK